MAKTQNDKDQPTTRTTNPSDDNPKAKQGPEAEGQRSAATLQEAMAEQDRLAREGNAEVTAEGEATAEETAAASQAAQEEAAAALVARDDEVYGRTPEAETTDTPTE